VPHNDVAGESLAKPGKAEYRRYLPHLQVEGKTIFLTFCTKSHLIVPEFVRTQVLHHCLHDHGIKIRVHGAVVMPDHVHMVFTPLWDARGYPYTLAEITSGIKGASAHSINRMLGRKGAVWQEESFDRVLRCNEAVRAKVEYVCANPIRKGLCRSADEYPWLWREWIEGVAQPPSG
jgi:REP element-mobilizing transposase RayT